MRQVTRNANAIAAVLMLVAAATSGPACRAAEDDAVDIAIDLPRQGTSCTPGQKTVIAGKASYSDNLATPVPHGKHSRGKHGNPYTLIPPDFTTPPNIPNSPPPHHNGAQAATACAYRDASKCFLEAYSQAKLALAASSDIFLKIKDTVTSPGAAGVCTLVVEVDLEEEGPDFPYPDASGCPGQGPITPSHPTICLAWPTTTADTDWSHLVTQQLGFYAQANRVLAQALDEFTGNTDPFRRVRRLIKKK